MVAVFSSAVTAAVFEWWDLQIYISKPIVIFIGQTLLKRYQGVDHSTTFEAEDVLSVHYNCALFVYDFTGAKKLGVEVRVAGLFDSCDLNFSQRLDSFS